MSYHLVMFRLPRRQTEIRLGRSGSMYVAGMVVVFIVAVSTQTNLLFWIFGALLASFVIALVLPWLMIRKLTVQRMIDLPAVAGQRCAIRYGITSGHRVLPIFGLVIREAWAEVDSPGGGAAMLGGCPHTWVMHMGPQVRKQAEAPCFPLRRGLVTFETMVLECGFPFEVFRCIRRMHEPGQLLVYPRIHDLDRRQLSRALRVDLIGGRQAMRPGMGQEFFGLRQYRPGDPLKRVDWKRTAKTGRLVARQMTQPSAPRLILGLDLVPDPVNPCDEAAIERAISLAASIINEAYLQSIDTGLVVFGLADASFPARHGARHRARLFQSLALLDLSRSGHEQAIFDQAPTMVIKPGGTAALWREGKVWYVGGESLEQWRVAGRNGGVAGLAATLHLDARERVLGFDRPRHHKSTAERL